MSRFCTKASADGNFSLKGPLRNWMRGQWAPQACHVSFSSPKSSGSVPLAVVPKEDLALSFERKTNQPSVGSYWSNWSNTFETEKFRSRSPSSLRTNPPFPFQEEEAESAKAADKNPASIESRREREWHRRSSLRRQKESPRPRAAKSLPYPTRPPPEYATSSGFASASSSSSASRPAAATAYPTPSIMQVPLSLFYWIFGAFCWISIMGFWSQICRKWIFACFGMKSFNCIRFFEFVVFIVWRVKWGFDLR